MLKKINYYWRLIATGFSFAIFGIGGIILRVFIFPILNFFVLNQKQRNKYARIIIRISFRFFIEMMRWLGVLRYKISNLERLQRHSLLILANHPTLIDTVFLMAFVKNADCIVKNTLWKNPFTRGPVHAAGYIRNNEDGLNLLNACAESLTSGSNLIIFPEGTRTPINGTIQFKRGATNIAVRCSNNITPVIIKCMPPTLSKEKKWWEIPSTIPQFNFEVEEDIAVENFIEKAGNETLAIRQLNNYLQNYFLKNLI